jgi:hypothetical protein
MRRSLQWMNRDDPSYDPNLIGAISQAKIQAALVQAGKVVLTPCVHVCRYDLVMEDDEQFFRVQCKTGRLLRGSVWFRPHSLRAARRETGWVRRIMDYKGRVDYFGVYCPDNEGVYLVPIAEAPPTGCYLRVTAPKNNQTKRIRWAKDYEIVPLPNVCPPIEDMSDLT